MELKPSQNPYLEILYCPRATLRSLSFYHPSRGTLSIPIVLAIGSSLIARAEDGGSIHNISLAVINGILFSFFYWFLLNFQTYVIYIVSIPFQNRLNPEKIRQIIAWSWLPILIATVISVFLFFAMLFAQLDYFLYPLLLLPTAWLWGFVIQLLGINLYLNNWAKTLATLIAPFLLIVALLTVAILINLSLETI